MKILRVKKTHIFDIFFGQGWGSWSRYLFKEGSEQHLGGSKLPQHVLNKAKEEISKWM